jgi:dihydropteroate synthase
MAIANITPDSFSDGGRWLVEADAPPSVSVVLKQCQRWVRAGARVVDVGGESTRPGADLVSTQIELGRVLPVIRALASDPICSKAVLSVDTRHAGVAAAALEAGADVVNDISGLADPDMAKVVAKHGAGLVVGHMRGTPQTMQGHIRFADLLSEVASELEVSMRRASEAGIGQDCMVVDPCIGFGKTAEQSAALSLASRTLESRCGRPVLIGASRKSFIGGLTGLEVGQRAAASVQAAMLASLHGAAMVRVHDVEETLNALRLCEGMLEAGGRFGVPALVDAPARGAEEPAA